jgi:hypothetical protein
MIKMLRLLPAVAIVVAGLAAPALAQPRQRPPDSDQTVPVTRGARLTINNFAGEVIVRTWDQDSLRVTARHSSRTKISIRPSATAVTVSASSSTGVASVDYEITAPAWMPVKVDGTYNFVQIEGAQSEVSATTVRGDITVRGGSGFVTAKSIEGTVTVDGAKGRIQAESVNEGIKISGSSGDITAETTNGDITLNGVDAKNVEVATVNGDITFDGRVSGGRYRFATHNGDIRVTMPETASATITVRTYNGDFRTNLPLKGAEPSQARRGRRTVFTLGSGAADMELESFGGTIVLLRPGTQSSKEHDH